MCVCGGGGDVSVCVCVCEGDGMCVWGVMCVLLFTASVVE